MIKLTVEEKKTEQKKILKKLKPILQVVDESKRKIIEPALERLAFLIVEIKQLEEELLEKGYVTTSGADTLKQNPTSQVYSALIKNYTSLMREITNAMPKAEVKKETKSTLASFLSAEK
jgi:hypothetical protein